MLVRGLTIILESDAPQRARLAYEMALVQRAMGSEATLFITGGAVTTLATPSTARDESHDGGVRLIVCQTALAEARLSLTTLDPRIEAGGLVSLMQGLGDDRLVVI